MIRADPLTEEKWPGGGQDDTDDLHRRGSRRAMKAIADIEAYRNGFRSIRVEILGAGERGLPKRARMLMDAAMLQKAP